MMHYILLRGNTRITCPIGLFYKIYSILFGDKTRKNTFHNINMKVWKIMVDLLSMTKKIARKIRYYDSIIDFSQETHWLNPFYHKNEILVIWSDNSENAGADNY